VTKRSITVAGHRTSISIEEPFWDALAEIAKSRNLSVAALVGEIDRDRSPSMNLSAAIRVYILSWYRRRMSAL
jgi:predicted DNA-binding ribbon-helix-helix protein